MTPPRAPGIRPRFLLRGLTLILTLALAGFLIEALGLRQALDATWIDNIILVLGLLCEGLF